jgi:hypothetical protein
VYALPALTITVAEVVRDQFATSGSTAPAPEPGVRLARVREVLANLLDRASRAVAPPRPRPAPRLAAWRG